LLLLGILFLALTASTSRGNLDSDRLDTRARLPPAFAVVHERLLSGKRLTEHDLAHWVGPALGRTPNGERRWRLRDCVLLTVTLIPGGSITCWKRE
jgi:hypothetical protein